MMNYFSRLYKYCNEEISDPRTQKWLFVDSPLSILMIILTYLYIVRKIGPKMMKNRKPYNVEKAMIIYNIVQVFLSSFIVLEHAFIVRLYFIAKILELLDTIFFILRKKWSQMSVLHVFHHSGMVFVGWVAVKYVPGGHSMPTLALNSFVHIIMYVYYLLLSANPELKKSIWWKKHITQLQLAQFVLILIHHLSAFIINCGYPRSVTFWVLNHIIFIALLFADFYRRAYLNKKSE